MDQQTTDLTPLAVYLDAQIAKAIEEVVRLRAMQATLRQATQPSVGTPAPMEERARVPPPVFTNGEEVSR
jgi:hypothetical protein